MSAVLLWSVIGIPAAAGSVLLLRRPLSSRVAVGVSLGTSAITAALAFLAAFTRGAVFEPFVVGGSFGLSIDGLAAFVLPAVAVVALIVLVFAAASGIRPVPRFHGLMLLFVSAVLVTVLASSLPALLLAWELMGALSYALIGFEWRQGHRVSSGLTAFLVTRTADLGLYLAAGAALAGGAGLDLAGLSDAARPWRDVIAAGILVAALGKAAQLPFSFWLSRAMDGPSPVSALLHSAAMVAMGGYLLLRMQPLLAATGWAAPATAWIGAATAIALGIVALAQRDLKQLLAASTSAQLGFVVLAAGVGSITGGTTQLVAHAATKALLFLAAGAWLGATGTKKLAALRGVARRWWVVGVTFGVGTLVLAGVPPLALWETKDAVLAVAREHDPALYVAGLVAAPLGAGYAAKALAIVWRQPAGDEEEAWDEEQCGSRRVPVWERVPLVLLAAIAAGLGVFALPPVAGAVQGLLGSGAEPRPGALELLASGILALAVVALVVWRGAPRLRWAEGWLGLEPLAHAALVRPTLRLAGALSRFDDGLDAVVTGVAHAGLWAARAASTFDLHNVDGAVRGLARGARDLGRLARRPQTGQLHQYYAQAVVVLAAAVILLVVVR